MGNESKTDVASLVPFSSPFFLFTLSLVFLSFSHFPGRGGGGRGGGRGGFGGDRGGEYEQ